MNHPSIILEPTEFVDPAERVRIQQRRRQFDLNSEWLQAHIAEVYSQFRGQCICIAGQQVFAAATAKEAVALARAAHPEDEGWFTRYIPREKLARIYAS